MSNAAASVRRIPSRFSFAFALLVIVLVPSVASAGGDVSPKAPSELALTGATDTQLSISWRQAGTRGGSSLAGYGLYVDGASAGTTTATRYDFSGLDCGTAYTLGIDAVDDAGRRSSITEVTASTATCAPVTAELAIAPAAPVTAEPIAPAAPLATLAATGSSFAPDADARVVESSPSTNYGSSIALRVDGGSDPDVQTYLRFAVSGLSGSVTSAKLRLYATSPTTDGPAVYATSTAWSETGITWSNRPGTIGPASDNTGSIATGTWADFDVTPLVAGNGTYAFVLIGSSSDGVDMSSRQGSSPPQLVISTGATLGDASAPTAPTGVTTSGATTSTVALAWLASTDNVGVAGYNVFVDGAKIGATTLTAYTVSSLACGRTYSVGVQAYDQAGNVSPSATVSAATIACPATTVACDKVAAPNGSDSASGTLSAPYQTAQKLGSSLSAGMTGCLRGGTYSPSSTYVLDLSKGGYTIRSYPGERAKLVGIVLVRSTASGVTLSHLDIEGTGPENTVKVYAADVIVEDNDVTNAWRGRSCMILGSNSGYGQALRVIVRRNFFHECGNPANGNLDHGIYAQNVLDGEIVGNVFWNLASYAIQLYPNAYRTRFAHNVIDGASPSIRGGVVFGGDTSYASKDNVVEYNVVAYAASYNITSTWSGAVGSGNVARNNCVWAGSSGNVNTSKGGFTASGNVTSDPLFVSRSSRDYRLSPLSPCLAVVGYDAAALLK